jgi:glycosyltransferase involved in cell wall biosynthesis
MKVIFWQNINSIHQAPVIRNLAEIKGNEIHLVASGNIAKRLDNGWYLPDISPAVFHERDSLNPIDFLNKQHQAEGCISVFSNPHNDSYHKVLWKVCREKGYAYGFQQAKPGAFVNWAARIARYYYYKYVIQPNTKDLKIILCNGSDCVNWLNDVGYPKSKLLTWGYFPEVTKNANENQQVEKPIVKERAFRFIYLGRIIELKRVDWIIQSLKDLKDEVRSASLTVIGGGERADEIDKLGQACLGDSYNRLPFVPHETISHYLGQADCLVLPSRQEEWGAVINESISCGIPVICSSACGAKDLLRSGCGLIFPSDDRRKLTEAMRTYLLNGQQYQAAVNRCLEFRVQISPAIVASYLDESLKNSLKGKPFIKAPWLMEGNKSDKLGD